MKPLIFAMAAAMALPAAGASNTAALHIDDLRVLKADSALLISFSIDPASLRVKSHEMVTYVPAIISDNDTVRLDGFAIAGKSAWMTEVRSRRDRQNLYRAGKSPVVKYSSAVDMKEWMDNCTVAIIADTLNECRCEPSHPVPVPVAEIHKPVKAGKFAAVYNYQAPFEDTEKIFNLSGKANIIFRVNRTDINWNYAGNRAELDSILGSIRKVTDNPDASVESITLTGYASPEGRYSRNVELAYGRTEEVRKYVMEHSNFPSSVFHSKSVPEDWAGLRQWLVDNPSFTDASRIIDFIDSGYPIEQRNDRLKQIFPSAYQYLLANVYPMLRHTDYVITYKVKKYDTVEELRKVFRERPANLSENEFMKLANSYPKGSPEYDEVLMVCAHIYHDNAVANLNAANAAMSRGQYAAARSYLLNVPAGAEKDFAEGVLCALEGDYEKALPLLKRAESAGIPGAAENLRNVESRLAPPAPEITIL
ncbi:MAG: hypothetical protein K2O24_06010 [Muribaculaceae bacterium]|nr:hypothetical protein [Muribaculaceae bacterium]